MNRFMAAGCMLVGFLLMLAGGGFALASAGLDTTTVDTERMPLTGQVIEHRVHNIGLIGKQESGAAAWGTAAIVGALLFVGGWIVSGVQDVADRLEASAAKPARKETPATLLAAV